MRAVALANEPMLVNTIGHAAGCLIFGIFLYLFLRDARGARLGRSILPAVAATLALLWNLGSLAVLAAVAGGIRDLSIPAAFSFSVLSFLPAVLLHISLGEHGRLFVRAGYAISSIALALHVGELFVADGRPHEAALLLISVGFGALAFASVLIPPDSHGRPRRMRGLAAMALFLLATSFVHFGDSQSHHVWSEEIALHHAGIPLSLFVLLQEHRFLLLDAFVRFLANAILASGLIAIGVTLNARLHLVNRADHSGFIEGLLVVGGCVALILFADVRSAAQRWLTRVVFARPALNNTLQNLASGDKESEHELLARAALAIAGYVGTERYELRNAGTVPPDVLLLPQPVTDANVTGFTPDPSDDWVEAIIPLRFSKGDVLFLLLGRRAGGRRYLSEDLNNLAQISLALGAQVERLRTGELNRLAAQAELRALQAQINPHFLFNALNALYGTIPRQATGARNTVLNLAEIFRYFLQTDRTFIALEDELRIVSAYLEIEKLRLGDRLQTVLEVSDDVKRVRIPALTVQPVVENAIKHGVASKPGPGSVRVKIAREYESLRIDVEDSGGSFDESADNGRGSGVGLENVRHRLRLCYGSEAELRIRVEHANTLVTVRLPAHIEPTADIRSPLKSVI